MPWKNPLAEESKYHKAAFAVLLLILLSLAFQIRFLNSIAVILPGALILFHPKRKTFITKAFQNPYFLALCALFLVKAAGLLYTQHPDETWRHVSGRWILLSIPLFFCSYGNIPARTMQRLMTIFSLALLLVSLICLSWATIQFTRESDPAIFFYHELVSFFNHHAIIFSCYLLYCIIYWMEEGIRAIESKTLRILLLVMLFLFFIMIVLLSSKLIIILSLVYLVYFILKSAFAVRLRLAAPIAVFFLLAFSLLIVLTENPIRQRFSDLANGSTTLFKQEQFTRDVYFNGLQFRLLGWRFTYEILNRKNAWLLGVSPGDAQHELNKRYTEANIYQGDGVTDKKGYMAFNTHNTFLQTILESGLIGLAIVLAMIVSFLVQCFHRRKKSTLIFFTAMLAFCFTDALLSGQYAMQLFIFLPLLSLYTLKQDRH